MAKTDIDTGDLVELKSGGPAMTVIHVDDEDDDVDVKDEAYVTCVWFTAEQEQKTSRFVAVALKKVAIASTGA